MRIGFTLIIGAFGPQELVRRAERAERELRPRLVAPGTPAPTGRRGL